MSDRKNCVNCNRAIDPYARTCVFCNWDQSETPPPRPVPDPNAPPAYVPPSEHIWRGKILGGIGLVALLVASFAIGSLLHGFDPGDIKTKNGTPPPAPVAVHPTTGLKNDITLVPVAGGAPLPAETPITSAPPPATPNGTTTNEYQRNDATALPSDQYAQAATRARAERPKPGPLVDPRTLSGQSYDDGAPSAPPSPHPAQTATAVTSEANPVRIVRRTDPIPEYQPVPRIRVPENVTVRLDLTVGANGHVTDIAISRPIPDMGRVIAAVQNWRFRPATENGTPVSAHFNVDISFHADE